MLFRSPWTPLQSLSLSFSFSLSSSSEKWRMNSRVTTFTLNSLSLSNTQPRSLVRIYLESWKEVVGNKLFQASHVYVYLCIRIYFSLSALICDEKLSKVRSRMFQVAFSFVRLDTYEQK